MGEIGFKIMDALATSDPVMIQAVLGMRKFEYKLGSKTAFYTFDVSALVAERAMRYRMLMRKQDGRVRLTEHGREAADYLITQS